MGVLCLGDDGASPPLLANAVEVMQRSRSLAQRLSIRNRRRDIRLGEQNCFGQSAPMRQVTSQRRGESTSRAMGGTRSLTVRLENFLFDTPRATKTEEVDRLLQMASSDHHIRRSQRVQTTGGLVHLAEVGNRYPGQGAGFVEVRGNQLRQRNQLLDY